MVYHDICVALRLSPEAETEVYRVVGEQKARWGEGEFFLAPPFLPHVALYHGRFVQPKIDAITLGKLCARIVGNGLWSGKPLILADHLWIRSDGWICWSIELTRELRALHEEVAAYLQRTTSTNFRESARRVLENRDTSRDIRERIRRFGGVYTGEEFFPHVSIGRVPDTFGFSGEICRVKSGILTHPRALIAGRIDEYERIHSDQVFWQKPMVELERKVVSVR